MLQDSPSGAAEPCFRAYRNVTKQGFKQFRCSKRPQMKYRNVTKHGFKQFLCSKRLQIELSLRMHSFQKCLNELSLDRVPERSSEQSENCVSKLFISLSQKMTVLCCKNASFGPDQDQCFLRWFHRRFANAQTCTGVVFGNP